MVLASMFIGYRSITIWYCPMTKFMYTQVLEFFRKKEENKRIDSFTVNCFNWNYGWLKLWIMTILRDIKIIQLFHSQLNTTQNIPYAFFWGGGGQYRRTWYDTLSARLDVPSSFTEAKENRHIYIDGKNRDSSRFPYSHFGVLFCLYFVLFFSTCVSCYFQNSLGCGC